MNRIGTNRLMNEYFATMDPTAAKKSRGLIDKAQVYEFEDKIGKELIDMNDDELFAMLTTFGSRAYTSYSTIKGQFKALFDYYSNNYENIDNPWDRSPFKGVDAYRRLSSSIETMTFDIITKTIESLYDEYPMDSYMPRYIKCLCLLFYCGFSSGKEILSMKREMVDFSNNVVRLPNKVVHLSEECIDILEDFYQSEIVFSGRHRFVPLSYHDSYFQLIVRENNVESFQDWDCTKVTGKIARSLTRPLCQDRGLDINYRRLYNLGFYNYLITRYGREKTNEAIKSVRSPKDTALLKRAAEEYGYSYSNNETNLKRQLLQYIVEEDNCNDNIRRIRTSIYEQYARDARVVRELKKKYNYRCQLCQDFFNIEMDEGRKYVEVHHIVPNSIGYDDEGSTVDHVNNLIVVCPNHHRYLHYHKGGLYELNKTNTGELFLANAEDSIPIITDLHLGETLNDKIRVCS